jgi:hypothetical protein
MIMKMITSINNTVGARSCRTEGNELLCGLELMHDDRSWKNRNFCLCDIFVEFKVTPWRPSEIFL